jgi:segregation and condensation protein B
MEPREAEATETEGAETVAAGELFPGVETGPDAQSTEDARLRALLEAVVYVTEEPLTLEQIAAGIGQPRERVEKLLDLLVAEYDKPEHGLTIRVVAGGYKMATKAEHHESVRSFVKSLKAPLKLSLPALETLAVVAYKQPVTSPEIMEIRGVQGAGVLKTLLDRKLIAAAGRKNVIGKPILYKTTKEFLIQFGLKDLSELPSLKEFEDIRRMAISDGEMMLPLGPAQDAGAGPADETAAAAEHTAAAESVAEAKAAPEVESGTEVDTAPAGESVTEAKAVPEVESGTEADATPAAEPTSEAEPEPEAETAAATEAWHGKS